MWIYPHIHNKIHIYGAECTGEGSEARGCSVFSRCKVGLAATEVEVVGEEEVGELEVAGVGLVEVEEAGEGLSCFR